MILGVSLLGKLIALTIIIHIIDTLSYSVRLSSVKSGNFTLSISLFNLIALVSRTANMLQGPLIGTMIDKSIKIKYNPVNEVRYVILATTIGTLIGIILIPTFLKLFSKAVSKLEETGSIPSLVVQSLSIANIKHIAKSTVIPRKNMISDLRYKNIPKKLLLLNALITGIYAIGVLSAYYAATYAPDKSLAVSASSGMINGIASILLTIFIDPKAAIITDEAFRGVRKYGDVKTLIIMLIGTKLIGTLIGQLLLIPSARFIVFFYK